MKNNKGITLIILIMTVILMLALAGLTIYSGIESYENSEVVKFQTYMRVLQKKVDILVEEKADYASLGSTLSTEKKTKLQQIIANDTNNYIETESVTGDKIRYFSSSDIVEVFEVEDINDDIVVNFENREVISLNGVEKDGTIYYVEKGL